MGSLDWRGVFRRRTFQSAWDRYAARSSSKPGWPGDEWGSPQLWQAWFERLFRPAQVESWQRAVEIGQGSGKYTNMVLEAGAREVLACDVSPAFLESCRRRLASHVDAGRLHLASIAENDPRAIQAACRARDWLGRADALFCIDAFVHLPFAPIASYMLAATEVLRPGGHLIFTFADGTSKPGQDKLLADLDGMIRSGSDPHIACFHWTSPELVRSFAQRIGFDVRLCEVDPIHGRDGQLVAQLSDPAAAAAARVLRGEP